jgi:hypothetical protein
MYTRKIHIQHKQLRYFRRPNGFGERVEPSDVMAGSFVVVCWSAVVIGAISHAMHIQPYGPLTAWRPTAPNVRARVQSSSAFQGLAAGFTNGMLDGVAGDNTFYFWGVWFAMEEYSTASSAVMSWAVTLTGDKMDESECI